jgi:hypothetical protein
MLHSTLDMNFNFLMVISRVMNSAVLQNVGKVHVQWAYTYLEFSKDSTTALDIGLELDPKFQSQQRYTVEWTVCFVQWLPI